MRTIIEAAISIRHPLSKKESVDYAQQIMKVTRDVTWTTELGNMIKELWSDPGIQEVFQKRGKLYQLNDTTQYFMENIKRINSADYIPTEEDVLRVRVRSTGIEEAEFRFDKKLFRVIDVGGQRSERRKWIHCFDGITAVLFCASLADYFLPLREDPRQNRLSEAIMLFTEVSHQETFNSKTLIFFLNKTDLLAEKLPQYPLEQWQHEYQPPPSLDPKEHQRAASEFIKSLFINQVDQTKRDLNTLFVHFTCALDTKSIEIVIKAVRTKLLNDLLGNFGL
jgi:GTPase SAR1 family protein